MNRVLLRDRPRRIARLGVGAASLIAVAVVATSCASGGVSSSPKQSDTIQTDVTRVRSVLGDRVRDVVDVTGTFPNPDGTVEGAVVLIDSKVGERLPRDDYQRRPVLVRYTTRAAARHAIADLRPSSVSRLGVTVLSLPRDFPQNRAEVYRAAAKVGTQ